MECVNYTVLAMECNIKIMFPASRWDPNNIKTHDLTLKLRSNFHCVKRWIYTDITCFETRWYALFPLEITKNNLSDIFWRYLEKFSNIHRYIWGYFWNILVRNIEGFPSYIFRISVILVIYIKNTLVNIWEILIYGLKIFVLFTLVNFQDIF